MKKYMILAAVAALTLASCAKIETNTRTVWDEDVPIGFSTYSPRSITKAGDTFTNTSALPSAKTIGVFAYSTPVTSTDANAHLTADGEVPNFITNGAVSFANASSTPTGTAVKRYWPKDLKNLLSFYGYYPYQETLSTTTGITSMPTATTAASAADGLGSFGFTQTDDVTTMIDFMISSVQNDMYYWNGDTENPDAVSANSFGRKSTITGTTYGIVPLTLTHMMSNVNFWFKTNITDEGIEIKVKEASISNVLSKGTFKVGYAVPTTAGNQGTTTFTPAAVAASAYADAFVIPIGSAYKGANETQVENHDDIILSTTAAINYVDKDVNITKNNFLFVPQPVGDNVKVKIVYDLKQGNTTTENTVEVKIKGVANDENNPIVEWKYNHKYNYIFTIGLHEILFTGAATTWTDGGTGNITVQ